MAYSRTNAMFKREEATKNLSKQTQRLQATTVRRLWYRQRLDNGAKWCLTLVVFVKKHEYPPLFRYISRTLVVFDFGGVWNFGQIFTCFQTPPKSNTTWLHCLSSRPRLTKAFALLSTVAFTRFRFYSVSSKVTSMFKR